MLSYTLKRLLMMIPLIFGITLITFAVIHLAPGGPVEVETEMQLKASAQAKENLKKLYGLDKPLHVQYIDWLKRFILLDFGKSFVDNRDVFRKIVERVPVTLTINLLSLILIVIIAVPVGVYLLQGGIHSLTSSLRFLSSSVFRPLPSGLHCSL